MINSLTALAMACAPNVHLTTLEALISAESHRQPYAIGVNSGIRLERQPGTREDAITLAKTLMAKGIDFDAGLGQINVRNWEWLNLTPETVFDPCVNLQAAQTVLTQCYERATDRYSDEQQALHAALSCYNTGHLERGFKNGYVGKVLAQAGIKIPALQPPKSTDAGNGDQASQGSQSGNANKDDKPASTPTTQGDRDGFVINPTPDGFTRPPEPPGSSTSS